jgi:hypothetical protein
MRWRCCRAIPISADDPWHRRLGRVTDVIVETESHEDAAWPHDQALSEDGGGLWRPGPTEGGWYVTLAERSSGWRGQYLSKGRAYR